jgi:murein L,D-transpeptidase YafK
MKSICVSLILIVLLLTNTSFKKIGVGKDAYYIVVDKSDYEMSVYDGDDNWIISYPVVFGNKDQGDKLYEGDRKTPEGTFHIIAKRPHAKWSRFMELDYPTPESIQKFNERKAQGLIPHNAKIGGAIGIHGTWPREDFAIDLYDNWTAGCISTKNVYIQQLANTVPVGTTVIIQK